MAHKVKKNMSHTPRKRAIIGQKPAPGLDLANVYTHKHKTNQSTTKNIIVVKRDYIKYSEGKQKYMCVIYYV